MRAQRWLDQQFFRAEYDAREILVSLAGRVPYEADPRDLVAMVVTQIDSALHPEGAGGARVERSPATARIRRRRSSRSRRCASTPRRCRPTAALVTLLRWSDKPLEVFLDDEQSPVARVPPADREWLAAINAALLVPIFAGGSDPRPFVGLIALGRKRSEEPYTPEDRELLRGIAVQMGVALDLSRLRKQVGADRRRRRGGDADVHADHRHWRQRRRRRSASARSSTASTASTRSSARAAWARCSARGTCGSSATSRSRWCAPTCWPIPIRARASGANRRSSRGCSIPSIVTVFDYGTLADGAAFLVMEFVPGEDLRSLLKRERHARAGADGGADDAALPAASTSAHKAGIFHRDLKPENILLPESGTGPKVVDFGVAKLTDAGTRRWTARITGGGHHRRDAGLHGAGAVARRSGRWPRRRLQPWRDGVRDADREDCRTAAGRSSTSAMKQAAGEADGRHRAACRRDWRR